jgi:hypothetical protein
MSKKFKHFGFLLCLLALSFTADAAPSLPELQALTNIILTAHSRIAPFDTYKSSLKTIKSYENKAENEDQQKLLNAKAVTNCYEESVRLDKVPPSKALPLLFALFENDELTDCECSLKDKKYNGSFGEWVYQLIIQKLQIFAEEDKENVMMLWLPDQSVMWNDHDLAFFWYYVGLKYLPVLWNDWYSIWKLENKRPEPREAVLKKLAKEVARQFNYHLFPFVAKAINDGDTTLTPLLKELSRCSYHRDLLYCSLRSDASPFESLKRWPDDKPNFRDEESFLAWWNEYKDHFIIPPSDKKLSDIKNIFERKYPPRFFTKEMYESALKAEKALDEYCKRENRPLTNCWYFNIKEGDLEK